MTEANLLRSLGQVSSEQVGEIFRQYLRGSVRQMIVDAIAEEVSELCGRKYKPLDTDHYRAGNAPGQVLHQGRRIRVSRSQVRGVMKMEVPLKSLLKPISHPEILVSFETRSSGQ